MIRRTLAVIALALALTGCARPTTVTPSTGQAPPSAGSPTTASPGAGGSLPAPVRLDRTGGFAGVNQSITIAPDGAWSYSMKGGASQTGRLSAAQLSALRDLVTAPGFLGEMHQVESGSNCADGFNYAITVGTETASWEDCGGASRPTMDQAVDLITQATPF